MKKCDSCGKLVNDSKDLFCPHCGAIATKSTVCTHTETEDRWNRESGYYSFHGNENTSQNASSYRYSNASDKNTYSSSPEQVFEQMKKTVKTNAGKMKKQQTQKNKTISIVLAIFAFVFSFSAIFSLFDDSVSYDSGNDYIEDETVFAYCNNAEIKAEENGMYTLKINSLCFSGMDNYDSWSSAFENSDSISCNLSMYTESSGFYDEFCMLYALDTGEFEFEKEDFEKNFYYSLENVCFNREDGDYFDGIYIDMPFMCFMITDENVIKYFNIEYDEFSNPRFIECENVCNPPFDDCVQYDYN